MIKNKLFKSFYIFTILILFILFITSCNRGKLYKIYDISYELSDDGSYYIACGFKNRGDTLAIDEEYNGLPVKEIKEKAFRRCPCSQVIIPDTIEYIGYGAFEGCIDIRSMFLPYVGAKRYDTFSYGQETLGYLFGNDIYNKTKQTTYNDNGELVTNEYSIPSSLNYIEVRGDSYIPYHAFQNMTNLAYLNIYDCVSSKNILEGCSNLYILKINSNTINDVLSLFGESEFENSYKVKDYYIPNTLDTICINGDLNDNYINGLDSLKYIEINNALNVSYSSINSLSKIEEIKIKSNIDLVVTSMSFSNESIKKIELYGNYYLEEKSFYNCKNLIDFDVYGNLNNIGIEAFGLCKELSSFCVSGNIGMIESKAFDGCRVLERIVVGGFVNGKASDCIENCSAYLDIRGGKY